MLTKARIRQVRSLSDKAARSENGLFVAEGRKMVGEALAAGADIERIYLTGEEGAGGWTRPCAAASSNGCPTARWSA